MYALSTLQKKLFPFKPRNHCIHDRAAASAGFALLLLVLAARDEPPSSACGGGGRRECAKSDCADIARLRRDSRLIVQEGLPLCD